ncbi:AAA family ATPase [Sphingomonas faeni]|uniref:AAA family ATPase n=1 Tax=Sphingomonas faeni TaxID=185950 RepID=UPI0035947C99
MEGLGVFGDFAAAAELPEFGRYNVVYGENGSGKTTLSRLFGCLQAGEHSEYTDLQFSIDSQSGALVRGQRYARNSRVQLGLCENEYRTVSRSAPSYPHHW